CADAKPAADDVEEIIGGGFADDFTDGNDPDAEVHGDQFESLISAQGVDRDQGRGAGAVQRVLMARIDHDLQHLRFDFPAPDQLLDGIFKGLDALASEAGDFDDLDIP